MYTLPLLAKDEVVVLKDIPQSSIGAPCPMIIADEHSLAVIFYLEVREEGWDGTTVRVVGQNSDGEPYAIVRFRRFDGYYHGAPNDEAFAGHPLSKRGLEPYGAFEVRGSSWKRRLMEMNRVHPCHHDESFASLRHFVLAFHDSTFECVAESYTVSTGVGSVLSAATEVLEKLKEKNA